MSSESAGFSTVSGEGGGSAGAVDFGALDVTFSASFYTGVFLSSRELQGNYEVHQRIVQVGLERKLPWGWKYPSYGDAHWQKTVSPVYFVGVELEDPLAVLSQNIVNRISTFKDNYEFDSIGVRIKFFEFGFGSVSIKFEGLSIKEDMMGSAEDLKKILSVCEKAIKPTLDSVVVEVAEAYSCCVPCCIKNSDIWDINNFNGLEITEGVNHGEGIYKVGCIEVINIFAVLMRNEQQNFDALALQLRKLFLCFSEELNYVPFNVEYTLFKSVSLIIYIFVHTWLGYITFSRHIRRKLHYICGLQKQNYKDAFKNQEKKNRDRKLCVCGVRICEVDDCHRCYGNEWHKRVFYHKKNKCFRCARSHQN